ncbi:MAG: cyclase family protein [Spirochaetaceae bacterium]|nr:cyclase family protein [Spirochaetaceae bacterium]
MNIDTSEVYDISMPITQDMPVFKGKEEKRPLITTQSTFATGSTYESVIKMNMHTGSHIDSKLHMIEGGPTVESLNIKELLTKCRVIDLSECTSSIGKKDLVDKNIQSGSFILLKTKNSTEDILEKEFIYLDRSGASYLVEKNIAGVGTDGLGIERNQSDHKTHILLMNKGIHILEGLRLANIKEGEYFLSALPILIPGVEASPIRAVLIGLK